MAKKKTAVKTPVLKAPILRQALSAVKTAIINFSPSHILFVSYNPSSKDTTITDIPQNLTSQFVLGQGSGIQLSPKVTATVVNPTNSSMQVVSDTDPVLVDDHLERLCPYTVEANGEIEIILVIPKVWFKGESAYAYKVNGINSSDFSYYGVISDTVNMAFVDGIGMAVTDPTQDASCTITMTPDI